MFHPPPTPPVLPPPGLFRLHERKHTAFHPTNCTIHKVPHIPFPEKRKTQCIGSRRNTARIYRIYPAISSFLTRTNPEPDPGTAKVQCLRTLKGAWPPASFISSPPAAAAPGTVRVENNGIDSKSNGGHRMSAADLSGLCTFGEFLVRCQGG